MLGEYLKQVKQHGLIDYAEVLHIAIARVQSEEAALPEDVLVLWPADLRGTTLEERLLEVLPDKSCVCLAVDKPASADAKPKAVRSDVELLCWLPRPADAPAPLSDGFVDIFRAVGEANEVREVLRRCLAGGIPLDEVELLHTDMETYVPLVYETMAAAQSGEDGQDDEWPVTFAEGIPCRYARPGRALAAWVAWVDEDFPQSRLVRMIREGLLNIPEPNEQKANFSRMAALLRGVGIGFGRDRYLPQLDEQIAGLRRQLDRPPAADDDDPDDVARLTTWRQQRLGEFQALRGLVEALLKVSPDEDVTQDKVLSAAFDFVGAIARSVSKLDNFARQQFLGEIADMRHWLSDDEPISLDAWEWLAALPGQSRVLGSGPRPGRLHVAGALSGGHSSRSHTFLVGLDDGRFPGTGSQDPVLLDVERRALSAELPTAASQLEEKVQDFVRLLARLRGKVTLSYPCRDLSDDREKFPSPLLLAAYRIISGNREGTQQDLLDWIPSPSSFAPPEADRCLNQTEWWLWRLCGSAGVVDAAAVVERNLPPLAHGAEALRRRSSADFTEHDGRVEQAGAYLDPAAEDSPVVSSGRLELIGKCPLAYFFRYGLKISPPDELEIDPSRWINPLVFGSLLHEVFEQFVSQLIAEDQLPEHPAHWPKLEAVLDQHIARYRELYPPPNQSVYLLQVRQLVQTARIFLMEEAEFCVSTNSRPLYLEASLGMFSTERGTQFDTSEPIPIALPDGSALRVRGRVDRIDQVGSRAQRAYAIWDYKTGSAWGYNQADPLRQGRVVQPVVYLAMVDHRLEEVISSKAQVTHFGFFFPGIRERGRRIRWSREQLADGRRVLELLARIVRNGAFLATNEDRDCGYCDFEGICGNVKNVAAASDAKLGSSKNTALEPFRELRGYGQA